MKEYDLISIGTGSAISVVDAILQTNPNLKVAVIDKDEPGGICLTRGCIPSKILLYPAEMVRTIERAIEFGIDVQLRKIDFNKVMQRMRNNINEEIDMIRNGLSESQNIDYYHDVAEFIEPYTLKVGSNNNNVAISAKMIFLCTGSKPIIPPIKGLENITYYTSDTILAMDMLPESIAIVGGGYIAAEYGHFFSSMGSHVTIVGRNKQFLPYEEAEISALAKRELGKHMTIITNSEVIEVNNSSITSRKDDDDGNSKSSYKREHKQKGRKLLIARDMANGERMTITAEEVLIAAGRGPNTNILHPERAGIKTDEKGWIVVNEYLETSQPNVWAFGDANGAYPFKHKANYEAELVYYNAVLKKEEEKKNKVKKDYHAVPHAVFTYPEIAAVGLGEREALAEHGENNILIGIARYEETAKGIAMGIKDYFVKIIVKADDLEIIGAHIIGPYASVLIQEIVDIMCTQHERTVKSILSAMHIHPALSEVVQRSVSSLMPPQQYHHLIAEHYGLSSE
jgi:mycothione reductase